MNYRTWRRIFKGLSEDIADRNGLKFVWREVDPGVKMQICNAWWNIVKKELNPVEKKQDV
jgi:hypothetical protein